MKNKIIVIAGPTATGKTKLSVELAKEYNAVIINADSTAIYKEPLIATAKVTEEEKEGIPHYMLDLISLDEEYTIYDFQKEGRALIDKLISENKNIIIVTQSTADINLYNFLKYCTPFVSGQSTYLEIIVSASSFLRFHSTSSKNSSWIRTEVASVSTSKPASSDTSCSSPLIKCTNLRHAVFS